MPLDRLFDFADLDLMPPKMDEKTRKRLNGVYWQEIHALEELLEHDLSTWRN